MLSYGDVSMIVDLTVLVELQLVTDRHRQVTTAYTALA